MAKIQKKSKQQFHLIPFFYFPPKDCPAGSHQTIFPQKPQNPQKFLAQGILPQIARIYRLGGYGIPAIPTQPLNYLPTEFTEPTEVSDARYSPTDCTDMHRLGGYGIPAIPTQPLNYLPTEFTEHTEVSDARYSPTDCTDVHRLGGYGIPAIPTQPPNYLPTEPYVA